MTLEEYDLIEEVRAMCHGFAAAVQLSLQGHGDLNIEEMGRRLQASNAKLATVLNAHPELYQLRKVLSHARYQNCENRYQDPDNDNQNYQGQAILP